MIYNKQTLENFITMMDSLKKEFTNQQEAYGWNFKFNLEQFDDVKYFLITNKFSTIKLAYSQSAKYIIKTSITDVDINRILKLKEGL